MNHFLDYGMELISMVEMLSELLSKPLFTQYATCAFFATITGYEALGVLLRIPSMTFLLLVTFLSFFTGVSFEIKIIMT